MKDYISGTYILLYIINILHINIYNVGIIYRDIYHSACKSQHYYYYYYYAILPSPHLTLELFSVPSKKYAQLKSKLLEGGYHIFKSFFNGLK